MSRRESVEKSIYDDLAELSRDALDLYLWSFINHRCNLAGLYKVSASVLHEIVAREAKVPRPKITAALNELRLGRFMFFDQGVVWVRSRIKKLPTKGPKIAQPIFREVAAISPRHPLRVALLFHYCHELPESGEDFGWLTPLLDTLNVVPHKPREAIPQRSVIDESSDGSSDESSDDSIWSGMKEEVPRTVVAQRLFEGWRVGTGKTDQTQFTQKRRAAVEGRLRDGYSVELVAQAIEGVARLPYNVNGKRAAAGTPSERFDDLELVCRSGENLERFAALAAGPGNVVVLSPRCRRCGEDVEPGRGAFCEPCSELVAEPPEAS